MNCPSCNVKLVMSERHGIEIDYCPDCRGIWLDRGELDKIIERSVLQNSEPDFSPNLPFNGHDRHDRHDSYKYQRKKNWLGELFD